MLRLLQEGPVRFEGFALRLTRIDGLVRGGILSWLRLLVLLNVTQGKAIALFLYFQQLNQWRDRAKKIPYRATDDRGTICSGVEIVLLRGGSLEDRRYVSLPTVGAEVQVDVSANGTKQLHGKGRV